MTKVMLIEDDQTMLNLLGTLLDMEGFKVVKVEKFDSIVDDIRREDPEVILMDVHLEDKDGIEILAVLRNDPQLKKKKVIMSSGMDKRYESAKAGADDFLMKPYMPDELIGIVKKLTGQVN